MITVMVVHESSGKPASGRKVALSLSDGVTSGHRTDGRGEAHFDKSPCSGGVFVDGAQEYTGHLKGRIVIYV